jgi:hypothetical protein
LGNNSFINGRPFIDWLMLTENSSCEDVSDYTLLVHGLNEQESVYLGIDFRILKE